MHVRLESAREYRARRDAKTTTEENNSNAMKDAYRKLAIQVYVEFPLRLLEEEKEAKEIEAILGEVDFSEEEEEKAGDARAWVGGCDGICRGERSREKVR